MIRLIGILTGSAIAISFLIVALGVPEFVAHERADTVPVVASTAQEFAVPALMPEPLPEPLPEPPQESVHQPISETAPEPEPEPVAEFESTIEPEPELVAAFAPATESALDYQNVPTQAEQNWYAFWSPFRSEIAADGFISELQRTTGLDYRVVKLKPGVYEVAFAYSDDTDIQDKLAQISAATGLEMTGS